MVIEKSGEQRQGELLGNAPQAIPELQSSASYRVLFEEDAVLSEIVGSELTLVKQDKAGAAMFSFCCVWTPGLTGHCTDPQPDSARDTHSAACVDQQQAESVCRALSGTYQAPGESPCGGCAWFTSWACNVTRCHEDSQILCFAYLEHLDCDSEFVFHCNSSYTQRGHGEEGRYYCVGAAQKVELEWAQNQMGYELMPVQLQDVCLHMPEWRSMVAAVIAKARSVLHGDDDDSNGAVSGSGSSSGGNTNTNSSHETGIAPCSLLAPCFGTINDLVSFSVKELVARSVSYENLEAMKAQMATALILKSNSALVNMAAGGEEER
jgi:hypothetical protein